MTDLSHWDFSLEFRYWEAASLMAGIDPCNYKLHRAKIDPIARRLEWDSMKSFAKGPRWVRESPTDLECCKPERTEPMFERSEIVRWLGATGLPSVYCFELSGAHADQSPRLTDATDTDLIDPSDLPPELDAANLAYRAITNGFGDQSATRRNRLIQFLESTYPDFKPEQIQRIATVANPDKTTGRKKLDRE
jgi:hypothetical protein